MVEVLKYIGDSSVGRKNLLTKQGMIDITESQDSVLSEEVLMNHKWVTRETFIVDKNGYMFHIVVQDTPILKDEGDKRNVNHRQLYYDLRNKEIYITLNNRELTINKNSLDNFITPNALPLFETEENEGLYAFLIGALGSMPQTAERHNDGRALIRLMAEYNTLEILYKATPNLCKLAGRGGGGIVSMYTMLNRVRNAEGTKPKDIFKVPKKAIKLAEEQATEHRETHGDNVRMQSSLWTNILSYRQSEVDEYIRLYEMLDNIANEGETTERIQLSMESDTGGVLNMITHLDEQTEVNLDYKTLVKYIYYDCNQRQGLSPYRALSLLRDYHRLVNHLPRFPKYPKYLAMAHDVAVRNSKLVQSESLKKGILDSYDKYSKFEMTVGKMSYLIPRCSEELAEEGAMQSNCVAGYARSVSTGRTLVIFMRDKKTPEQSLVTIEVRDNAIVQAYKSMNRNLSYEQFVAMREWAIINELEIRIYPAYRKQADKEIATMTKKPQELVREPLAIGGVA